MAYRDYICYGLSLVTAIWLTQTYSKSIAYDRPVHTAIVALLECGFIIVSLLKVAPDFFGVLHRHRYTAIPLEELGDLDTRNDGDGDEEVVQHPGRVRISVIACIVALTATRLEILRRVNLAAECTIDNVEVFLPLLLAIYDSYRFQKPLQSEERFENNIYESVKGHIRLTLFQSRYRYILPSLLLSLGSSALLRLWRPLNSTYICAIAKRDNITIPVLQIFAFVLDFLVLAIVYEMVPRIDGSGLSSKRNGILMSSSMIGTGIVWSIIGFIVFIARPDFRTWITLLDRPFPIFTSVEMIFCGIIYSLFCITTLYWILRIGVIEMIMTITATCIIMMTVNFFWSNSNPFPPASNWLPTISMLLVYVGWSSFQKIQQAVTGERRSGSRISTILFLLILIFTWFKKDYSHYHPIDLLIYEAEKQHQHYLATVKHSSRLEQAVNRYQDRYHRNPPPGFDVWFEYAINASALIIDEYDQIYDDLLPFRSSSPQEIRKQTWEMLSNPWNEISGISIRNGVAEVQDKVLPTHRWMLEGVAVLVNKFAQYLPDMDLAFNLNDEPRVVVPYSAIHQIKDKSKSSDLTGHESWSSERNQGWLPVQEEDIDETRFTIASFHNIFEKYGSVACAPTSSARQNHMELPRSHLCTNCASPHSLGQFVSNWSLLGDICHQPDMAHLHGFYLSPAAFKPSYDLMPVFSQSKASGFNDILYPSAWNYMDKVIYSPTEPTGSASDTDFKPGFPDPPYNQKQNTLFWRGATSEGVSYGEQTWRGMARQRFVHLGSNLTNSQHDTITVLLPDALKPGKFTYRVISGSEWRELGLDINVAIVDNIARCGGPEFRDCKAQENEFNLVRPTDFQSHWQYRYLFDLDGAGFSGRFIPFLQSRSLPFKTALFREWYDSRLTAWKHFVPQDIRLHGVFSTLAYFAGIDGNLYGRKIQWNPHIKEGENIAEEGRNWANQVLRKEDMELYFFRLLLEWGRLTDDNRDNLGFVLK